MRRPGSSRQALLPRSKRLGASSMLPKTFAIGDLYVDL